MANEKRLIDANALIMELRRAKGFSKLDDKMFAVDIVNGQDVMDAVEMVHGRWEYDFEPIAWCEDYVKVVYTCSVCECRSQDESHYCPNCGAKMDEPKEDAE